MSAFFVFVIVLFILAALLRIDFFFTVVYFFVGVYIALRFWSGRMLRNLTAERSFANRAFIGDTVTVTLRLENKGRLPIPWLMFNEAIPWALSTVDSLRQVISLPGKTAHIKTYQLIAKRRGYYKIGPLIMSSGDLLGLNHNLTARLEADYLIVYPKILPMPELGLPTHSPQAILPTVTPVFQDPSRIIGVRDYRWGDNPRHIHWPATAAAGRVAVKQFQPAIARESVIFLNLARADYHRAERAHALELAITTAASLAAHILNNEKLPVGLDTAAMDPLANQARHFSLSPSRDQAQLMQILEVLARVQPADQGDFVGNLRRQALHLPWGATVIIITGQESEGLAGIVLQLKQAGFSPSLVFVGQQKPLNLTAKLAVPVFDVWREKDVETWTPIL